MWTRQEVGVNRVFILCSELKIESVMIPCWNTRYSTFQRNRPQPKVSAILMFDALVGCTRLFHNGNLVSSRDGPRVVVKHVRA